MDGSQPYFLMMAGPNGAGESTCVACYLPAGVPFIDADDIARTLSDRQTQEADVRAARIALERMDEAEVEPRRESFATETTLASRTLAGRARRLQGQGYFIYLWSPRPDFSVQRVASRVELGGHHIPEDSIRRRWSGGLKNFFFLYQPIADHWDVVDNTKLGNPVGSRRVGEAARSKSLIRRSGTRFDGGRAMRPDEATAQETPSLDGPTMIAAMARGVAKALRQHRAMGVPVATWDETTQQVVSTPANQIPGWIDATPNA